MLIVLIQEHNHLILYYMGDPVEEYVFLQMVVLAIGSLTDQAQCIKFSLL